MRGERLKKYPLQQTSHSLSSLSPQHYSGISKKQSSDTMGEGKHAYIKKLKKLQMKKLFLARPLHSEAHAPPPRRWQQEEEAEDFRAVVK